MVQYSTQYFTQVDGDPANLTPDILAALASADYFGGRDPALEAILAYHP